MYLSLQLATNSSNFAPVLADMKDEAEAVAWIMVTEVQKMQWTHLAYFPALSSALCPFHFHLLSPQELW